MSHRCAWPGCRRRVLLSRWGCHTHWHLLPNDLRTWLGRAYRLGMETNTHPTSAYLGAYKAALAWISEHHPEAEETS